MDSLTFPPVGRLIAGKYRIDRLIGQGGMGAVYAGRHELLDQPVAVKLLIGDLTRDAGASARFLNEARAAARIPSDHVVRVLDVGIDRERPYFVMELLEGRDLSQLLEERGRLQEKEAVSYVLEAIEALAQAHALGIIHRDLKPSNLFLARRADGSSIVKVLDFGIAKAFGPTAQTQAIVQTQGLVGSPAYMAPEYVRSAKSIDTRADIWAIGVILHELVSGGLPFPGENPGEVLAAILEKPVPTLSAVCGRLVSAGLSDVVVRCLARKPDERFQELADVADALIPFAGRTSPSTARIRSTVTTLRLRPPTTETSVPAALAQAATSPNAETAAAPSVPRLASGQAPGPSAQQTNQSWSDADPELARAARGSRILAALGGVAGAMVLVAGFLWFRPSMVSAAAAPAAVVPLSESPVAMAAPAPSPPATGAPEPTAAPVASVAAPAASAPPTRRPPPRPSRPNQCPPSSRVTAANRTRVTHLAAFALVALAPSVARAASPPAASVSAADALFNDGVTLFDAGHVTEACAKFSESYRLDPANGTLQNLALCHVREGKRARALTEFSDLVGRAAQAGQKAREQMARGQVEELEKHVARVTLTFPDPANVEAIALDGDALARTAWSSPVPLDPGDHTFTFSAAGKRTEAHPLAAPDAAAMLHLDVPTLIDEPKAGATGDASDTTAPKALTPSSSSRRTVAIVLGGAGVVMLGVGTYFGIRTFAKKSDGDADCNGSLCTSQGLELQNEAHTAATWSTVTFGAGLGLVAAGAIVWFTAPHDAAARGARVRFVPALGPRVAGGSLAVTF